MAVSKQQLAEIIGKARDLCSPEGDRIVEFHRGNGNIGNNGTDPDPSSYDDYSQFDRMYLNEEEDYQPQQQKKAVQTKDIRYNQQTAANSKMPDKIKQSMLNEVIDVSALDNQSVLSGMNIPESKRPQQRRQVVNEQQYSPQVGNVDYSIIKAIVNECLNEYFSRQPLNESNSISTIGLKAGSIKIVDNKGNVYSAKLEKIGNTNK